MSKRFIDISILPKGWRKVSPTLKLAFYHFWNTCDKAGVIEIDPELYEFEVGAKFPTDEELNLLENLELIERNKDIILICDYSLVDNGRLGSSNAHKPAWRSIEKYSLCYNSDNYRVTLEKGKSKVIGTLSEPSIKSILKVQEEEGEKEEEREEIKGGMGEKEIDLNLANEIAGYFGFSEIRHADKFSQIYRFLNILETDHQTANFREQFAAYQTYKEQSREARFSFPRFLGTIESRFQDGGWNSRNWVFELKKLTNQGAAQKTDNLQEYNKSITEQLKQHVS